MSGLSFKILYLGKISCQRFRLIDCSDKSAMIDSPMSAILIQHPSLGNILYDTGNSPFYTIEHGTEINSIYPVTEFISIHDALTECNIALNDIDKIILSHLHFDHAGGLRYFEGTKAFSEVIISEKELGSAFCKVLSNTPGAYIQRQFDLNNICYRTYCGEWHLNENIILFEQHSHTAGLTGLILKTKNNGNFIFPGDTVYTKESYTTRTPPGGHINETSDEFYSNLLFLEQLQKKYRAQFIFGHDFKQITELSKENFIS